MRSSSVRFIYTLACLALLLPAISAAAQAPAATSATPAERPMTAEMRAVYVGTYEVPGPEGAMPLRIYEEGERLMAQPPGEDGPTRMIYLGNDVFRPEAAPGATVTFTVVDGKATRFTVVFPDERRMEGVRKE